MKNYTVNELRKMFLDYFDQKDHFIQKSASLIPQNDHSLLLINSGMAPLKPYFTGQEIPPKKRMATCQKCIRTGDIENVGKTARHGTFFEMLGNFSFGDYFKKEAIEWSWDFLTRVVGLDAERLYPSVYQDDEEAFLLWNQEMKIPKEKIFRFGKEDNFWEHGAGPCGPCSEIYYDRGEEYGCGKETCTVGCDCDRYMEIWNNVFTQFQSDGQNHYTELTQKNIDTGMGLERLAVVVQNAASFFEIDTLKSLLEYTANLAKVTYGEEEKTDISLRVITDHIRSVTFMIGDGILPSNEGRGYVLRRLLRRALCHGHLLSIQGKWIAALSELAIEQSKDAYVELLEKREMILTVIQEEEQRFDKTLEQGLLLLENLQKQLKEKKENQLSGKDAFRLYDTYGFPLDLMKEILAEHGISVEEKTFLEEMEKQKDMARSSRKISNYMGTDTTIYHSIDPNLSTEFVGYEQMFGEAELLVIAKEDELVQTLAEGEEASIFVKSTPFYATKGGQQGDSGFIRSKTANFEVWDTIVVGEKIAHIGKLLSGTLHLGELVQLEVKKSQRQATAKNHSATHLLHKALREVLGKHVEQAGSFIDQQKLRFDFTHYAPLTQEELQKIEKLVNQAIEEALPVSTQLMSIEEAKKSGAMALFNEKYGDTVRVVSMGKEEGESEVFSKELCGGTHVENTANILKFKIVSESSVAAGVRRIEAITAENIFTHFAKIENDLLHCAMQLNSKPHLLSEKIDSLLKEVKKLEKENSSLKQKLAVDMSKDLLKTAITVKNTPFLCAKVENMDKNNLQKLGDELKEKLQDGVVLLLATLEDKVHLLVMATDHAVSAGVHAGNLVKELSVYIGGKGGGRPHMAQAGGNDFQGMEILQEKARIALEKQLL
ncbi:alanine--tRNA ligase [Clostridia bacterium]|nr:alanine--tRNA ligase [Clostridia bacterium]